MSDTELSVTESPSVPELSKGAFSLLAVQHVFAMFGATVLVPLLTGLNPSVALISAGLGTLVFHFVTGKRVPVFLGSSFAFIGVIQTVLRGNATHPATSAAASSSLACSTARSRGLCA